MALASVRPGHAVRHAHALQQEAGSREESRAPAALHSSREPPRRLLSTVESFRPASTNTRSICSFRQTLAEIAAMISSCAEEMRLQEVSVGISLIWPFICSSLLCLCRLDILRCMSHSRKLQKLCALRGLDQATLAQNLGISRSSMSRLLSGAQEPKLSLAAKLARLLGVSLDYLGDDEVPLDAHANVMTLSEDEHTILKLVRRVGVEEAYRRLLGIDAPANAEITETV